MSNAKGLLTSKTFWGAAVAVAGLFVPGVLEGVDQAALIGEITTAAGALFAIWGRVKADKIIDRLL